MLILDKNQQLEVQRAELLKHNKPHEKHRFIHKVTVLYEINLKSISHTVQQALVVDRYLDNLRRESHTKYSWDQTVRAHMYVDDKIVKEEFERDEYKIWKMDWNESFWTFTNWTPQSSTQNSIAELNDWLDQNSENLLLYRKLKNELQSSFGDLFLYPVDILC